MSQLVGLRLACSMFTVVPVRSAGDVVVDRASAAAALRWLPGVGAALGVVSGVCGVVFWHGGGHGSALLGAVVAVGVAAALTRGLHLDGLADVADGLGSRRPPPGALEVMKQSDIGPFGVAAVLLAVLLQVTALATVWQAVSRPQGVLVFAAALLGGRLLALDAAAVGVPSARPGGFGDLVAGSATLPARLLVAAVSAVAVVVAGLLSGIDGAVWGGLLGGLALALLLGRMVRGHLVRRLGGVTGDVFGALIEGGTTVVLLAVSAAVVWQ